MVTISVLPNSVHVPLRVLPSNVLPPIFRLHDVEEVDDEDRLQMDLRNVPANVRRATPNAVQLWKEACFFCSTLSGFGIVTVGFALTNSRLHFRGRAMIISFSSRPQLLVWVSAFHVNCALIFVLLIQELHARCLS